MKLPSSGGNASRKSAGKTQAGRIPGASREQSNDYNAFLKPGDIGKLGSTAKLTLTGEARMASGTFGDQIVAEVKLGRVLYDWSIKLNSPNHREVEDRFGLNTAKWRNKVIGVEVKLHMDREYIAVQRERASKPATKKAKRKTAKR